MTQWTIGQRVLIVEADPRRRGSPRFDWYHVTKVGRQWVTVTHENQNWLTQRFQKDRQFDYEESRGSLSVWLSHDEYEAHEAAVVAWQKLRGFIERSAPPFGVTKEAIVAAAALLGRPEL
jgi:hypothetical protein